MGGCHGCCKEKDKGDNVDARKYDMEQAEKACATGEGRFCERKSLVTQLMDVALLLANISQLNTLLKQKTTYERERFYTLLVIISTSILLQVVFAILELVIFRIGAYCDSCNPDTDRISRSIPDANIALNGNGNDYKDTPELFQKQSSVTTLIQSQSSVSSNSSISSRTPKCACFKMKDRLEFTNKIIMLIIIICNAFITGFGVDLDQKCEDTN